MANYTTVARKRKTHNSDIKSGKERNFWLMNKNLGNYPLARDPRVRMSWRLRQSGWWHARLPGEPRISLRLPPDAPDEVRRAPRAFDIKVLAAMLTLARTQDAAVVNIRSQSWMLEWMGMAPQTHTLRKLQDSLEFWCWLRIVHQQWHVPKHGHEKEVRLPPPLKRRCNLCEFHVAKKWRKMGEKFAAPIPLPLPDSAAAQNLVLWLMTGKQEWIKRKTDRGVMQHTPYVRIRTLANKIGTSRVNPWSAIRGVCEQAAQWFQDHGASLEYLIYNYHSQIKFITTKLKIPKSIEAAPKKWTSSRKKYQEASRKVFEYQQRQLEQRKEKERREQQAANRRRARIQKEIMEYESELAL